MEQRKPQNEVSSKKVFISSTYEDMIPYREKAMEALRQMQQTPLVMEDFEANTNPALDVCYSKIDQCDLFLLIVGFKYGNIYKDGKSFVELEYDYALKQRKPILVFVVSENAEVKASLVDKGELAEKLDTFKKKLAANHTVKAFDTVDSLYGFVLASLKIAIVKITDKAESDVLSEKEALNRYKKFLLMPNRYHGTEAILMLRVISGFSGWTLRDDLIKSLGLTVGDTIECDTVSVDEETNEMLTSDLRKIDLFADQDNAEWLVNNVTHIGTIIKVHVKFVCKLIKDVRNPSEEILKVALVLIKGIEATPPKIIYK